MILTEKDTGTQCQHPSIAIGTEARQDRANESENELFIANMHNEACNFLYAMQQRTDHKSNNEI